MKNKIIIILSIIIILLLFICFSNLNMLRRNRHYVIGACYGYFMDINLNLRQLKDNYSSESFYNLESTIKTITDDFCFIHQLLIDCELYVDTKINYSRYFYNFKFINKAFRGELGNDYQGNFWEDGRISDSEAKFIDELTADIETMISMMALEDDINLNPKVSTNTLNIAINNFFDKWNVLKIDMGFSPYNYLLLVR